MSGEAFLSVHSSLFARRESALSTRRRFKSTILTEGSKSIKSVDRLYPKSGGGSPDGENSVLPRLSVYIYEYLVISFQESQCFPKNRFPAEVS